MRRREVIVLVGGAAASSLLRPLAARAQQAEPMRRIGVLMNRAADQPEGQAEVAAFQKALQQLGWNDGRNVRLDIRWSANDVDLDRKYAAELVALAPDVVLANGTLSVAALQRVTRNLSDRLRGRFRSGRRRLVDSLARPGGNVTGFMIFEYSLSGKWLELLKQIAPSVTRAAVLRDSVNPAGIAQFGAIQAAAQSLGIEVSPVSIRDAGEIERAVAAFARSANGGLIVTPSAGTSVFQNLIIALAAQHRLPAVYALRSNVAGGGLISYGPDWSASIDPLRLTSIASSRARSRPIFRFRRRPSSNWSSTSRPRKRSASIFRRACSRAPTR